MKAFNYPHVTIGALARRLEISPEAVQMLVQKGELPELVYVNGMRLFRKADVFRWLKEAGRE